MWTYISHPSFRVTFYYSSLGKPIYETSPNPPPSLSLQSVNCSLKIDWPSNLSDAHLLPLPNPTGFMFSVWYTCVTRYDNCHLFFFFFLAFLHPRQIPFQHTDMHRLHSNVCMIAWVYVIAIATEYIHIA